jgi:hypothetical protein
VSSRHVGSEEELLRHPLLRDARRRVALAVSWGFSGQAAREPARLSEAVVSALGGAAEALPVLLAAAAATGGPFQ